MLVLPKKGDPTLAKNLRLILVEECMSKLYQCVLNKRLTSYFESICPEYSNGFRPGRGTPDANCIFKQVLRKRHEHDLESWMLFLDIVKAFDRVDRPLLWRILVVVGTPPKMDADFKTAFVFKIGRILVVDVNF